MFSGVFGFYQNDWFLGEYMKVDDFLLFPLLGVIDVKRPGGFLFEILRGSYLGDGKRPQ